MVPRILVSTTSHKREPLGPTLEVLARLGLTDIDLNLHHVLEEGVPVETVNEIASTHGLRIWIVSGGWCDFFHSGARMEETTRSVARQVEIARRLGAAQLRLFFGRLKYEDYSSTAFDVVTANLRQLSERHPEMLFNFENHDGASLRPDVCRDILEAVGRPNIRMNFDPINFERVGVNCLTALELVARTIGHVHLKGLDRGEFCEFGVGDVDLRPFLQALGSAGYHGGFSVEYEGRHDGTLRLYESVKRARSAVEVAATNAGSEARGT
jgi:sugar phosphate isomerase/epimerase